jgi:hypothetical protein
MKNEGIITAWAVPTLIKMGKFLMKQECRGIEIKSGVL